jgi:hypothetical protein
MRRIVAYSAVSVLFLCAQPRANAQNNFVVPAGTLLHCTLDEPNFSSATADIGDPVVCHLSSLREFGQNVFPRGSYLGGHLEADKEPGHFWGKGYLKIEFDRIGFPASDVPVPSKVIAAKGYKVDKKGDVVGKGHATRDVVEWLIPPLWPWKIITLPARGPRPALKGESQVTVRLMDDIEIPRAGTAAHSYDRPASYDRPPAYYRPQIFGRPAAQKPADNTPVSDATYIATNIQTSAEQTVGDGVPLQPESAARQQAPASGARVKMIALKSDSVYAVTSYRIDGGSLNYVLADGTTGSVDITEVDWRATSRLNVEPVASSANKEGY